MILFLLLACWTPLQTYPEACDNLYVLACECQDGHLVGAATEEWEVACEGEPRCADADDPVAWNLDFHNCYQKELTKDCDEKAARAACAEYE